MGLRADGEVHGPAVRQVGSSPVSERKLTLVVPVSAGSRGEKVPEKGTGSGWTGAFDRRE